MQAEMRFIPQDMPTMNLDHWAHMKSPERRDFPSKKDMMKDTEPCELIVTVLGQSEFVSHLGKRCRYLLHDVPVKS